MESLILKIRIASIIQFFQEKASVIDLGNIFDDEDELDSSVKEYIYQILTPLRTSESFHETLDNYMEMPVFSIYKDINDTLQEWTDALYKEPVHLDANDNVNVILKKFSPTVFNLYEDNVAISELMQAWITAQALSMPKKRFLAFTILYVLTKAFGTKEDVYDKYIKAFDTFFKLKNYLLHDEEYPEDMLDIDVEIVDIDTGIFEMYEIQILKTITAASGVAQSMEREDLEGKKTETGIVLEKSKKKKYPRIEKLED